MTDPQDRHYVYGIMGSAAIDPFTGPAIGAARGSEPIKITRHTIDGVSVLATKTTLNEIRRTRRNLISHTAVIERAMTLGTVLPMRFGTIVDELSEIAPFVAAQSETIAEMLATFEGHYELGVKVKWDRDRLLRDLLGGHPDLAAQYKAAEAPGPAGYQAKINLGRHIGDLIEAWRKREERALLAPLKTIAPRFSLKAPEEDIEILRADFLVTADQDRAITGHLEAWQREYGGAGEVQCIGPAPLYNFVSLSLAPKPLDEVA